MPIKCRIRLKNWQRSPELKLLGAPEREIQINVDPYKMTAARVSFTDIENAVSRENRDITGGLIEVGNMKRTLKVRGQFANALDICKIL